VSATDLDDFTDEFLERAKVMGVSEGRVEASAEKGEGESDVPL